MDSGTAVDTCHECEQGVYFLQPVCPACGADIAWEYTAPCVTCGEQMDYLDGGCSSCGEDHSLWRAVELAVLARGGRVRVWRDAVPRPGREGYRWHVGSFRGQWADYRRPLTAGCEFHALDFGDHYEVHLDDVGALDSPGMHLLRYGPRAAITTWGDAVRGLQRTIAVPRRAIEYTLEVPLTLLPESDDEEE